MWRSLGLVAMLASGARADRKEAPADTPRFDAVESITLELSANAAAPRCQKLEYSLRLNVGTWAWVRTRVTCSDAKGAGRPKPARETGLVPVGVRATIAKQYGLLGERAPKICKDAFPVLIAEIVGRDGSRVRLVDEGCEAVPRLRELAATLATLRP